MDLVRDPRQDAPPPLYTSWADYLARTTEAQRLVWCRDKAKRANRRSQRNSTVEDVTVGEFTFGGTRRVLQAARATERITAREVYRVLVSAEGRCVYCGSLAVEPAPLTPDGHSASWRTVGRRIGSLEHVDAVGAGGQNEVWNLAWSCMWCNTWESERVRGATDHGAVR